MNLKSIIHRNTLHHRAARHFKKEALRQLRGESVSDTLKEQITELLWTANDLSNMFHLNLENEKFDQYKDEFLSIYKEIIETKCEMVDYVVSEVQQQRFTDLKNRANKLLYLLT